MALYFPRPRFRVWVVCQINWQSTYLQTLAAIFAGCNLPFLCMCIAMPESPSYLVSKGKVIFTLWPQGRLLFVIIIVKILIVNINILFIVWHKLRTKNWTQNVYLNLQGGTSPQCLKTFARAKMERHARGFIFTFPKSYVCTLDLLRLNYTTFRWRRSVGVFRQKIPMRGRWVVLPSKVCWEQDLIILYIFPLLTICTHTMLHHHPQHHHRHHHPYHG